jgi:DNA modification methylase
VLDLFVGSGTTAIAANRIGRQCIGIDINSEYVKIAQKRLKNVQTKVSL